VPVFLTRLCAIIPQYCDRGAILAGGRLELFDDVASAFERYRGMLAGAAT
jgi:ABC-type polysaccharide/polyol phosphate transport system ATPase subunit